MQRRLLTWLLMFSAVSVTGCGQENDRQDGIYELDYKLLSSNSYGLSRRVFQESLKVCISENVTTDQIKFVDLSFQAWKKPLKDLHPDADFNHEYNCSNYVLKINWSASSGRAHTTVGNSTATIQLYANSFYETVLHEFGHAFGLGDTYGSGSEGQPDSVMRLGRFGEPVLYPDDIDGIQKVFTNIQARAKPPEIYSDKEACETDDGDKGKLRKAKKSGKERLTTCVSTRDNSAHNFELKLGDCENGQQYYGLFSEELNLWLPEVGLNYQC